MRGKEEGREKWKIEEGKGRGGDGEGRKRRAGREGLNERDGMEREEKGGGEGERNLDFPMFQTDRRRCPSHRCMMTNHST